MSATLLLVLAGPTAANADPIPFVGLASVPGFQGLRLTLAPTLTLSSAEHTNFIDPTDPVYGASAPVFVDSIPTTGPFLGFFEMDPISIVSSIDNGTTTFLLFGPGDFSIALFDPLGPTAPFLPFVQASFASVALAFANDGSSRIGVGNAVFSGLSFAGSGLQNPGMFVFQLGEPQVVFLDDSPGVEYAIDLGILAAQPPAAVPEPATMLLIGSGMAGAALRRAGRKLRRRR